MDQYNPSELYRCTFSTVEMMTTTSSRPRGTRTEAVVQEVRARLARQLLASGDRLPSIRGLAAALQVSPSTVVEAYDRLAAEGLIRARKGSGFYVTGSGLPAAALIETSPSADRAIDPFWVSRQALDPGTARLLPGCGWLPADWMPAEAIRRALRAVARGSDALLADYGPTRGSVTLRRRLQRRLSDEGLDVALDQVLLTGSGTQAIDLILRALLRPGDRVLIDDPCYFNFRALLQTHPVEVLGVPWTPRGPDAEAFEAVVASRRPRLYLTNSALHNPTGATMSPQIAHRLLGTAARHDLTIVEDDIFADFEAEPSVRLAALDGLERVIRIGSFSKTLSASIRCGHIVARPDWIEVLLNLQVASSFGGPSPLVTAVIEHVLGSGAYRRHLDELHQRLARARREVGARLRRIGLEPWVNPRGGCFLWCRLPDGMDSAEVARAALEAGIVLAPGNVFSVSHGASGFLRFNVAQARDPRLFEVLRRVLAGLTSKST